MTVAADIFALLERFAAAMPLPRVRALHLPPKPTPGDLRGEFCALELDDGSLGLSYVLLGDTWAGMTRERERLDPAGRPALEVARAYEGDEAPTRNDTGGNALTRTLGFAAVNALTRCLFERAGFSPDASGDSIGNLDPQPGETIGMIGYFAALAPRITARGAKLVVVELREDLAGLHDGVRLTLDASELQQCDKVLATGTMLLNDTLDQMLGFATRAQRFALIGPSVGCPPDPLFSRGVTLMGGTWITDAHGYVDALVRGEATAPFARKSALAREGYPGWPALLARAEH
jgi:uncharacterized protein (DUF4213/DUF364 family)